MQRLVIANQVRRKWLAFANRRYHNALTSFCQYLFSFFRRKQIIQPVSGVASPMTRLALIKKLSTVTPLRTGTPPMGSSDNLHRLSFRRLSQYSAGNMQKNNRQLIVPDFFRILPEALPPSAESAAGRSLSDTPGNCAGR